jgi:ribosome-binding factor A
MKRELGELISRELTFTQLVTVQDVDITPDLKHAHVYVSVLGGTEGSNPVLAKLHDHRKELQALLSRRVVLKFTPQLHFKLDETVERGSRIIDILQTLDIPEDSPQESKDPNELGEDR